MRNTIEYSKRLEGVGLTREQAEVHLEILSDVVEDEMATKTDIQKLEMSMKEFEKSLKTEMEASFRVGLSSLEAKLTYRMALMLGATVAALASLQVWLN